MEVKNKFCLRILKVFMHKSFHQVIYLRSNYFLIKQLIRVKCQKTLKRYLADHGATAVVPIFYVYLLAVVLSLLYSRLSFVIIISTNK